MIYNGSDDGVKYSALLRNIAYRKLNLFPSPGQVGRGKYMYLPF
jgi:hypothetical protein